MEGIESTLNLYSRGRVLKIASFEGPMILREEQLLKKLTFKAHGPEIRSSFRTIHL